MTSLDEEIIVDVDLNKTIPCDAFTVKCEKEAEWLLVRKCCGYHEHKCTEHKEKTEYLLVVRTPDILTCALCGASFTKPNISTVYSYIGRL